MTEVPTLGGAGFARLIAHLGDDATIRDAARVSFRAGHAAKGEATRSAAADRELIRYLMRHRHTGPFEFPVMHFHVRLPIFIARQRTRHRTFSHNEVSGRYRELGEEVYLPPVLHGRPVNAKQGRGAPHPDSSYLVRGLRAVAGMAAGVYREVTGEGVALEQARAALPLGTMTEFVFAADLHNLLHFLGLRLDAHAQAEMQEYAAAILSMVTPLFPLTVEAWQDYRLNAPALSRAQWAAIRAALPACPEVPGMSKGEAAEWAALWSSL